MFSDLTLAQQLEVLKKKNRVRELMNDENEDNGSDEELEGERDEQVEISRIGSKDKETKNRESMQRVNNKEKEKGKEKERLPKVESRRVIERTESKEKNGEEEFKKSGSASKKDKKEEGINNEPQKENKPTSIRQPVKLHLDEVTEDFSHVTFCKLDRLSKAIFSHMEAPINKPNNDINRVDNAIAKWALKM